MLLGRMSTNFETNFLTLCVLEDKDDSKGEEMSCATILIYSFKIFWFIELVQITSSRGVQITSSSRLESG